MYIVNYQNLTIMKYLLITIFLCLFLISCKTNEQVQFESENFELIELADGVFACIHKFGGKAICNVGIVDNGKETIIFDTFLSPEVTIELLKVVEKYGLSPIKFVINSHYHNDHIRGNQVFDESVDIISTYKTKDLIAEIEPQQLAYEKEAAEAQFLLYDSLMVNFEGDKNSREYKKILMWQPYYEVLTKSHEQIQTRLPNLHFEDEKNLDGPKRKVQLIARGAGHSPDDMIMYLPDDDIVFTEDLVFNDMHPFLADGDPDNLLNWLDYIKTLHPKTIVPGHGNVGDAEELNEMGNYIHDLKSHVANSIEKGETLEELIAKGVPEKYKEYWFERFYNYSLSFMYGRLNAESN